MFIKGCFALTGIGTVVKILGDTAVVKVPRASACGHDCGECRLCDNPDIEAVVLNPIGAKEGDRVKINQSTSKILFSAFIIYILPIIGAFLLYALIISFTNSPLYLTAGEVLWILVWLLSIRSYSKKHTPMSIITEVVSK